MPCDVHELAVELARRFNEGNIQELERELVRAQNTGELSTYLARLWRIDRFARFKERQLRKREWINFREIVDWCSELGATAEQDEARRVNAYTWLQDDWLDGDFEDTAGKSRVLYLFHRVSRIRITRTQLLDILRTYPPEEARSEFLDRCWLQRPMFQSWLAKHNLPLSPSRFEPRRAGKLEKAAEPISGPANSTNAASGPTSKMPLRPAKPGPRQAAWDALAKRFPDRRIPNEMSSSILEGIVNKHVDQHRGLFEGRIRNKISLDTVLRAAGRR
jgi:hypothetical protein